MVISGQPEWPHQVYITMDSFCDTIHNKYNVNINVLI